MFNKSARGEGGWGESVTQRQQASEACINAISTTFYILFTYRVQHFKCLLESVS